MDIQEQLFYAVLNCDCRHVEELLCQGADVNHWFCYTKFDSFYSVSHVVYQIGHYSYFMLAIQYVLISAHESNKLQYGKKVTKFDWISFNQESSSFSSRCYTENEISKLLVLLVTFGADMDQEIFSDFTKTYTSPIKVLCERCVERDKYAYDILAAVIKTNKVDLYAKHCQNLFKEIFNKRRHYWYGDHSKVIQALILVGYNADYDAVKYYRFVAELPKYFLFYCIEYKNVFAFLY